MLHRLAALLAYLGGAVISGVGLMSAASIAGRALLGRPILGDFELVEIGTAVAGSLFLPYCQVAHGHVIVDFFTLRAGARTVRALDRFGALAMATMLLLVGWRTLVGCVDIARSGHLRGGGRRQRGDPDGLRGPVRRLDGSGDEARPRAGDGGMREGRPCSRC